MGQPCAGLELGGTRSLSWVMLSMLQHSSSFEDHRDVAGFGES